MWLKIATWAARVAGWAAKGTEAVPAIIGAIQAIEAVVTAIKQKDAPKPAPK